MPKWKVESVPDVVDGLARHYVTDGERKFQIAQGTAVANELSSLLNTLEEQNAAMQEERRWRKIGEEWPHHGQECQLSDGDCNLYEYLNFNANEFCWGEEGYSNWAVGPSGKGTSNGEKTDFVFTHWRPAPSDLPSRS